MEYKDQYRLFLLWQAGADIYIMGCFVTEMIDRLNEVFYNDDEPTWNPLKECDLEEVTIAVPVSITITPEQLIDIQALITNMGVNHE